MIQISIFKMAASNWELDSFLSKFKYLSSAGFKASIIFKTENFTTHVSLDGEVPCLLPPCNFPPPSNVVSSPRRRSPAYYRRLQRRREARTKSEDVSSLSVPNEEGGGRGWLSRERVVANLLAIKAGLLGPLRGPVLLAG